MTASSGPVLYTAAQRSEAAEWFVLIRDESPERDFLQDWLRWMDADEGNRRAFEAVESAWNAAPTRLKPRLPSRAAVESDDYSGEELVRAWLRGQHRVPWWRRWAEMFATGWGATGPRGRRVAFATSIFLVLGLVGYIARQELAGTGAGVFQTKIGEQFEIVLSDGSHVWLGAHSRLSVAYTASRREIRLESGEAYFSVHKDKNWPFVVHSVGGDITAVGTAFDVRVVSNRVSVAVTQGVVSVAPERFRPGPDAAPLRVGSGQQLTIDRENSVEMLVVTASLNPGERARWREGVLVYRDETLRDVVLDLSRYSPQPLTIGDRTAGELRFSGVIYKGAIEEWASALPESFPVTLDREPNGLIIRSH